MKGKLWDCLFTFDNIPGTNGYVQFTGLPMREIYTLKVVAETEEGETATIKRKFRIGLSCHNQHSECIR